eukprot:scaffold3921_cov127-Isochrysis_galbana.AAC.1
MEPTNPCQLSVYQTFGAWLMCGWLSTKTHVPARRARRPRLDGARRGGWRLRSWCSTTEHDESLATNITTPP